MIASIVIILAWQVIIAAPFSVPLEYGGRTDLKLYLQMSKFFGGDGRGSQYGWGAAYEWSIYWKFISEEFYYSIDFLNYTKTAIFLLNIYHFFVRKNAFPRCWNNLIHPFTHPNPSPETEKLDTKFTTEALLIGNMCGVIMCPGGHS